MVCCTGVLSPEEAQRPAGRVEACWSSGGQSGTHLPLLDHMATFPGQSPGLLAGGSKAGALQIIRAA